MFKKDKCYSGETANKMVQNMVIGYKTKIKVLREELQQAESNVLDLRCSLMESEKTNNNLIKSVDQHISKYNKLLFQNNQILKEIKILKFENKVLQEQIDKFKSKKSSSENPFISKEFLTSYEVNDFNEIKFHLCEMPNGNQYIDARKYSQGFPTRKGICLDLGNFTAFIQYCRKALTKAITMPKIDDLL